MGKLINYNNIPCIIIKELIPDICYKCLVGEKLENLIWWFDRFETEDEIKKIIDDVYSEFLENNEHIIPKGFKINEMSAPTRSEGDRYWKPVSLCYKGKVIFYV